jgi:ankyrin repeat protein
MLARIADGRTDLVFDYLAAGNTAQAVDDRGVSLLQWCAYYGDVSAMRYLLAHGATLQSLGDNYDLNGAAFHGHWPLCQFLLEQGASANHALPDTGETPLHAALCKAQRPHYNLVVQVLLAHGADPNRATTPGVVTGAFMRDCRTRGETPLHRAAAFGDAAVIDMLLKAGAKVEARDAHGESPLCWASWHGRSGAILRLLSYGPYSISDRGVQHYRQDQGLGWGGLEASLRGQPLI